MQEKHATADNQLCWLGTDGSIMDGRIPVALALLRATIYQICLQSYPYVQIYFMLRLIHQRITVPRLVVPGIECDGHHSHCTTIHLTGNKKSRQQGSKATKKTHESLVP